jgi:hypothetical protein
MDGGSADHAGAVICRHAGEFGKDNRTRPHGGLLQGRNQKRRKGREV